MKYSACSRIGAIDNVIVLPIHGFAKCATLLAVRWLQQTYDVFWMFMNWCNRQCTFAPTQHVGTNKHMMYSECSWIGVIDTIIDFQSCGILNVYELAQ